MKRAVELFTIDRRPSSTPFVDESWWARSAPATSFISVAAAHWEMVASRQRGAAWLTVRGPETKATIVPIPEDAEHFGIQFSLGTFLPSLPPGRLVDRSVRLPSATSTSFWLDGSTFELPGRGDTDAFVERLAAAGLLVHDPEAPAAVQGAIEGLSRRSTERRVARVTGLTRGVIRQIRRAEAAVELLSRGVSPADAAARAGYADQPHLNRSLKRFVGLTPTQVACSATADQ